MIVKEEEYWSKRAKTYGRLDDVNSKRTAYKIINQIKTLSLPESPMILDVGCGEGTITRAIRENFRHSNVLGIDLSEDMIDKAMPKRMNNLDFKVLNFANLKYRDNEAKYDLIVMSLFLHHMIGNRDTLSVLKTKYLLKENGHIIIAEAIPPEDEIFDWYKEMFTVKENRNCYRESDLIKMIRMAGFVGVRSMSYRFDLSLNTWLNDRTLNHGERDFLKGMHYDASAAVKKAYNMKFTEFRLDIILSCKMIIVSGGKSLG